MPRLRPGALHLTFAALLMIGCAADAPSQAPPATDTTRDAAGVSSGAGWRVLDTANRPSARHENALVAVDGRLYLLGGRGERPLDIYDAATRTWTVGTPPPLDLLHHTQAVAHAGRIWVLGALTGKFPDEPPVPTVLIYDPSADAWSEGAAVPEARRRGASGVAVHDGIFYLVGGLTRGHTGGFVPWLDAFDPANGAWTALADAPHARDHFQAAVLDGRLYAAAGRTSSQATGEGFSLTIPAVDVYDIAAGTWSTLDAPLPTPRAGTATVAWQGRVIVMGGESGTQTAAHDEVEAWNPATSAWETLPPLPVGRHGTQAALLDDGLHIVAGSRDRGGGPELDDHLVLPGL